MRLAFLVVVLVTSRSLNGLCLQTASVKCELVPLPREYPFKKFPPQMESFLSSTPVLFRLEYLYLTMAILPVIIVIPGIVFYFKQGPSYGYIPSLGECMVGQPQERIFGVGMTIEAVFLLFFGLIRDHIMIFLLERASRVNQKVCRGLLQVTRILIVIACFALIVCACVPANYNEMAHHVGSCLFFATLFGYFLVSDILRGKMKQPGKVTTYGLTGFGLAFALIFALIRSSVKKSGNVKTVYGVASVSEYLSIVLLFIKLIAMNQEMPRHGIRLERKMVYRALDAKNE